MTRLHVGYLGGVVIGLAVAQIHRVWLATLIGVVGLVILGTVFTWWDREE